MRVRECESERVTFEHRHGDKSCSACRESVNESVKVLKVVKVKCIIVGYYNLNLASIRSK